ncbi:MAG TPA: hypothetical protein VF945_04685 [Polyangia bacterium]
MALAALALVGCQGNGGAVSVRWRIANLSTGETFDPGSVAAVDGSCCSDLDPSHNCQVFSTWVVPFVSVTLRDPSTAQPVPGIDTRTFLCERRESTTAFVLPAGTFAIGLSADVFDGRGNPAPGVVPPPEVRTIVRGEVVNLQDIQIGVQPLPAARGAVPLPRGTAMVTF